MKEKVNDLIRLHKTMQEKVKTASYIQNKSKFLPWYQINGIKYTVENILMFLNTLFELDMKSKKELEY